MRSVSHGGSGQGQGRGSSCVQVKVNGEATAGQEGGREQG